LHKEELHQVLLREEKCGEMGGSLSNSREDNIKTDLKEQEGVEWGGSPSNSREDNIKTDLTEHEGVEWGGSPSNRRGIILKRILQNMRVWNGFMLLRIGPTGCSL
jgi:hypothetical protein